MGVERSGCLSLILGSLGVPFFAILMSSLSNSSFMEMVLSIEALSSDIVALSSASREFAKSESRGQICCPRQANGGATDWE